jgi:hypothetical protein
LGLGSSDELGIFCPERNTMIEHADPDRIEVLGGQPGDKERYIKSDFLIRSGMCPNGHGLMTLGGWGQECPKCGFTCNTQPELQTQ